MPTGPDKKFTLKPLTGTSGAAAKTTLPNTPAHSRTAPLATEAVTSPVRGASGRKFAVGQNGVTNPVDNRQSINFAVEALKEIRAGVVHAKKEALSRLTGIQATRMGAELQQQISARAADEAAQGAPPVWTPFGNVDLPFVKTAGHNAPRYDPGQVFAMCLGAETELKKQIVIHDATIKQVEAAITFLNPV